MRPRFHVREDVAPLKLLVLDQPRSEASSFHVREDVAPLKQAIGFYVGPGMLSFPRPRGRGPIEAGLSGEDKSKGLRGFHVREDVAPLKPPWP